MQFWIQNKFFKKPNLKKFYCYGKSKLKLSTAIPLLITTIKIKLKTQIFKLPHFHRSLKKVTKKMITT